MLCSHCILWHMILIYSIKVHVNFENLNKVVSARLLHHKLPFFFSLSISINWRAALRVWECPIPPHTFILFRFIYLLLFLVKVQSLSYLHPSQYGGCVSFSGLLFFFLKLQPDMAREVPSRWCLFLCLRFFFFFFSLWFLLYLVSEKAMAPHSSTLPGKSHGWRSLVGCSPWGH